MVHFSASPKNEPHSHAVREQSLFTSRIPSEKRVIKSYKNIEPDSINMKDCSVKILQK
ncbi:MAG: hypothetical protein U5L45_06030 [Saprospiraceae bacterium]|nr:hypothetical protein [Saprospiraceae bacterium]